MIERHQSDDLLEIEGYALALDRAYQPDDHLWVQPLDGGRARIGMDPLGVETSGTLAQLAFEPVGTTVASGEPFGSLEAAKFVGPLIAPISGTIAAHNFDALADPSLVERDPFGAGWLIEVASSALDAELALLLRGDAVRPWFEGKLADYRLRGVIAE
jgi:glycine cleavage system H protein